MLSLEIESNVALRSRPSWSEAAEALSCTSLEREVWHQRMQVIRYERITCVVSVLFGKGFRRCDMLPTFAVQRAKKRQEILLLLVR